MTIRLAAIVWCVAIVGVTHASSLPAAQTSGRSQSDMFQPSTECMACHNSLTTASGEDVSIGISWRASMMANSARDPYWQASVRRETIDHPADAEAIEHECATCHMPMSSAIARAEDRRAAVFAHLPVGERVSDEDHLAADGVSCMLCHQISAERLGTDESFVGGFVLAPVSASGHRRMFGSFAIDTGRTAVMRSAAGVVPTEASHLRESELCATCHTLITTALGPKGEPVGRLPEQVPYQEWLNSSFRAERTCQSCHMPVVSEATRITSVLGEPREGMNRHTFFGGNFFMQRMLNRYRDELGVAAQSQELEAAARATVLQLQQDTAVVTIARAARFENSLEFDVDVRNLTGHKLPTGYPSRRVWLHVTVRDGSGRVVFESGSIAVDGSIAGNANDADASVYEPHYDAITQPDQVQIYESVMNDPSGAVTTGLLQAVAFAKDNRLLPRGFQKADAGSDIAVRGAAAGDANFTGGGDSVTYRVPVGNISGPFEITAALMYQPVSFRWAQNLDRYDAAEPRRFVSYFRAMSSASSTVLASAFYSAR